MKNWKKYLLSLAATVLLCAAMTPAALAAFDGTYIDYRAWSQDQMPWGIQYLGECKNYGAFNKAGCLMVSFAKLAVQAGVREPGANFNPAVVNQLFDDYDLTDGSGQLYVNKRGTAASLVGLTYEGTIASGDILPYLRRTDKNYMVILYKGGHFVPIDKETSLANNGIYFHQSWTKDGNRESPDYHWVAATYKTYSESADFYIRNMISKNYTAEYGTPSAVWLLSAPLCSHPGYTFHNDYSITCNECGEPYIVPTPTGGAYMDVVDVNSTGTAPSHVTPYGDATILTRYNLGDKVYVLGSVKNAFNNTWYQLATGEWLSGEYLDTHIHCVNGKGYCTYCLDQLQLVYMNNTTLSAQSKSFPIHFAPYGDSPKFPTKCSGSVTVNGKIVNCYGNVWYSLSSGGWVWGDYLNTSAQMGTVNLSSGALALNNYSAPSPSQSVELFAIPAGESVYVYPDESIGNWYAVSYGILKTEHVGFAYGPCITIEDDYRGIEPPPGEPEPGLDADDTPSGGDQPSTPPADPGPSGVSVLYPTDPTYVGKFSVSDTNATVVGNIIKPAGSHVTACGVMLFDDTNNLIKEYSETITNVGDSLTSFHAWYDINSEVGVTLTPGTTYSYRITTTINGKNYVGKAYSFTTTGTPPAEDITPPEIVSLTVRGTVSGGAGATVSGGSGDTAVQADGTFSFEAPEDTFDVTVKKAGCLTYTVKDVTPNGADVDLGEIKLVQGDVNADEKINMQDLRTFLQNFNKQGEKIEEPLTDVNSDSKVNMQDLRVFLQNFNKTAAKDCTVPYSA